MGNRVNIVLISKKVRKEDPGNYGPLSFISVPSKAMEKIILGGTENHLKDDTVIRHSFGRGKSCLSKLMGPSGQNVQQSAG
ncbi:hypothetical protein WISP_25893 [Willisornis vidua]|uniref:Uncharacterized protein n=1 Tax=Willisornis vidua TaxID=1566151 RepID=A0ABQ9DMI6_9PASS|nr:hypothetical protein WISP_25893 [Willisornis vidua]